MDKIAIYQLFLRVFGNKNTTNKFYGTLAENGTGKFADINEACLQSIKELGITHVWYTGVIEHATMEDFSEFGIVKDHPQVVKGIAGSPYAIKDYYDVNPYLAENPHHRMDEFEAMLARTHAEDLKAIIDFVPNHVARNYFSDVKPEGVEDLGQNDDLSREFSPLNNYYYIPNRHFDVPDGVNPPILFNLEYEEFPAKATGNDVFSSQPSLNDWFETVKLNYGVDYLNGRKRHFEPIPNTWKKMLDILLFWSEKGVDGFRCDMAEMVPVEFWHWVIQKVKAQYPQVIFIAEIYNPNEYRNYIDYGKFDYLYDKVGLYDALRRLIEGKGNATDITRVWQQESGDYAQHMLRFLENHDEHRICSEEFGRVPESAYAAMMLSATLHTGPVMIYGGQEFGVKPTKAEGFSGKDGRTTIFDFWGLPELQGWINGGKYTISTIDEKTSKIRSFYQKMLHFVQNSQVVKHGQFHDLQYLNGFWQSKGYDERSIYAYLRYTKNECLLFIYNFDLVNAKSFEMKLPQDILKVGNFGLVLNRVFEGSEQIILNPETEMVFEVTVEANNFKIFKLESK